MRLSRRTLLVAAAASPALGRAANVGCANIATTGELQLISNSFPAMAHIAAIAQGCTRPGFKVMWKLTPQSTIETEQAFGAKGPAPFDAAVVSMATFSNLYARRQLQPLDDLVAKFGARYKLEERMLVRMGAPVSAGPGVGGPGSGGPIMAIAFLQNTQMLYYRADLFAKHGLAVPTDYAQMVQAAAVLQRDEPSITFPIAQGFAKGFDGGTEFTNLLASLGGRFFQAGSALPVFNSEAGVQAVAVMRSLLPYMTPNVLASNSDDVVNQFQQGKAAMGVLWASRASRMDDAHASKVVGQMQFAAAPAARAGGPSAAHLWWDAAVLPRNNPHQREATFHVLMEALSEAAVQSGNDLGQWVRSAYVPGRFGAGVALAQRGGAPVWPSEPFFGLAHAEVGKLLPEALLGQRPPQAVLDAAAANYLRSATEKGFIRAGDKVAERAGNSVRNGSEDKA